MFEHNKTKSHGGKFPLSITLTSAIILSACGGGGGDDSGSSSSQTGITETPVTLAIPEGTNVQQTLNGAIQSIKQIRGDQYPVTASSEGTTLTIAVGDLQALNADARFEVMTNQNTRYIVSVVAENTSADALIEQARALAESSANAIVADDLRLANVALELKYLGGQITNAQKQMSQASNSSTVVTAAVDLSTHVDDITRILADNAATESQLQLAIDNAQLAISDVSEAGGAVVDRVRLTVNELLDTDLPSDIDATYPVEFVTEAGRYSRFMTTEFGTLQSDGSFTFKTEYDFLNSVFPYAN